VVSLPTVFLYVITPIRAASGKRTISPANMPSVREFDRDVNSGMIQDKYADIMHSGKK
jgi:hypothetical protein